MMIHFSSLSVLLLLRIDVTGAKVRLVVICDLKDAERLDDKQVFFELPSELRDSKDSDPGVALAAAQPSLLSILSYGPYGW